MTMLASRLVKFKQTLYSSNKLMVGLMVRIAAEDRRTVMGRTLARLKSELNGMELTCSNIRKNLKYFPVPENEVWRLGFLDDLLVANPKEITGDITADDLNQMIRILCTS